MKSKISKAILALEDGTWFEGISFGAEGEVGGEVVFNTAMTGYQEILTDPSYCGQMVAMTYPLIGNTGINPIDIESRKPFLSALIVHEYCDHPSNWRSVQTLKHYLCENHLMGIEQVDTRRLTMHLRKQGVQRGILSTVDLDLKRLVKKAQASPSLIGRDLVQDVTCTHPYVWKEKESLWEHSEVYTMSQLKLLDTSVNKKRSIPIAVLDCGVKYNILRQLSQMSFDVKVFPASTSAKVLMNSEVKGIFISNGPGDPSVVSYVIDTVRQMIGKLPIFGICLGHQILGLALGGQTYKLKFGHHGANQPVLNLKTRQVEITSQNHGFAVDVKSLDLDQVVETHINLNDNTSEGLELVRNPGFSVQYHPEAAPGPHDSRYLFSHFRKLIEQNFDL
jgi:carbamoyl-phosphate synthase small subunit